MSSETKRQGINLSKCKKISFLQKQPRAQTNIIKGRAQRKGGGGGGGGCGRERERERGERRGGGGLYNICYRSFIKDNYLKIKTSTCQRNVSLANGFHKLGDSAAQYHSGIRQTELRASSAVETTRTTWFLTPLRVSLFYHFQSAFFLLFSAIFFFSANSSTFPLFFLFYYHLFIKGTLPQTFRSLTRCAKTQNRKGQALSS